MQFVGLGFGYVSRASEGGAGGGARGEGGEFFVAVAICEGAEAAAPVGRGFALVDLREMVLVRGWMRWWEDGSLRGCSFLEMVLSVVMRRCVVETSQRIGGCGLGC